jgi:hypothetical protein
MPHPRVKYLSQEVRGGVLRHSPDPDPNVHGERAYSIRLDTDYDTHAPLGMAVWFRVVLSEAERRQWALMLLEGL